MQHFPQYEAFVGEGEAAMAPSGVVHVVTFTNIIGEPIEALCGSKFGPGRARRALTEDLDCMTCIVRRYRFAAEVL